MTKKIVATAKFLWIVAGENSDAVFFYDTEADAKKYASELAEENGAIFYVAKTTHSYASVVTIKETIH